MQKHLKIATLLVFFLGFALVLTGCGGETGGGETDSEESGESEESTESADQSATPPVDGEDANPVNVEQLQSQVEEVYSQTHEAMVNITSQAMSPGVFNQPTPQQGTGSGFLWDDQGFGVTNDHVVQNANTESVTLADGDIYEAELLGRGSFTDLAVLRIEADQLPTSLDLADSHALRGGDRTLRLGNLRVPVEGDVIGGPNDSDVNWDKDLVVYREESEESAEITVGRRSEEMQTRVTQ